MTGFWGATPHHVPASIAPPPTDATHVNGQDDPGYWSSLGAAADEDAGKDEARPHIPPHVQERAGIQLATLPKIAITAIPPRPWCYGYFLLTGHVAVLGGRDGAGKGFITASMILSIITGKPLLGEKIWVPGPVALISYEDDLDEWHRRLAAACVHHGVDIDLIRENTYFLTLPERKIVLARILNGQTIFPDGDAIVEAIKLCGAVAFMIDPFNHAHEMDDGNNNVLIARVAGETGRIARLSASAGMVLHHVRKGANGDPDDLMGATSLKATFRNTRLFKRMDDETAKKFGVEPWRYLRIAGTKENYAPPPEKSVWFCLHSVALGNGTDLYTEGDNVAAAAPWKPPSPFEGLSWADVIAVLEAIHSGVDGERYTKAKQTERWAGRLLTDRGRSPDQAASVLDQWLHEGVVTEDDYESPKQRRTRKGLFVNPSKLAEMRAGGETENGWSDE